MGLFGNSKHSDTDNMAGQSKKAKAQEAQRQRNDRQETKVWRAQNLKTSNRHHGGTR